MDLIAVGQGSGDVVIEDYEAALAAGPITPPAMAGLDELLHKLKLDDADHNPFVSEAPVSAACPCTNTLQCGSIPPQLLQCCHVAYPSHAGALHVSVLARSSDCADRQSRFTQSAPKALPVHET